MSYKNQMLVIRYFTQVKDFTLHNPNTKESAKVYCNYIGFSDANLFTGIKSIKRLGEDKGEKKVSLFPGLIAFSRLGQIFPVLELISIISVVVFFLEYFRTNILYVFLIAFIAVVANFVIFILSNYFMLFCVFAKPKRNGWFEAYIDDYGTVSIPDKKTGKTIPFTTTVDGKKTISLLTQKESDQMNEAFFGKNGFFSKKTL